MRLRNVSQPHFILWQGFGCSGFGCDGFLGIVALKKKVGIGLILRKSMILRVLLCFK